MAKHYSLPLMTLISLLISTAFVYAGTCDQNDKKEYETCISTNPDAIAENPENAFEAIGNNPSILGNPNALEKFEEEIKKNPTLLSNNPKALKAWGGVYHLVFTDGAGIASFDKATKTAKTEGPHSTSFKMTDFPGAKVLETGEVIFPNGAKVAFGEAVKTTDDKTEVRGGTLDLTTLGGQLSATYALREGSSVKVTAEGREKEIRNDGLPQDTTIMVENGGILISGRGEIQSGNRKEAAFDGILSPTENGMLLLKGAYSALDGNVLLYRADIGSGDQNAGGLLIPSSDCKDNPQCILVQNGGMTASTEDLNIHITAGEESFNKVRFHEISGEGSIRFLYPTEDGLGEASIRTRGKNELTLKGQLPPSWLQIEAPRMKVDYAGEVIVPEEPDDGDSGDKNSKVGHLYSPPPEDNLRPTNPPQDKSAGQDAVPQSVIDRIRRDIPSDAVIISQTGNKFRIINDHGVMKWQQVKLVTATDGSNQWIAMDNPPYPITAHLKYLNSVENYDSRFRITDGAAAKYTGSPTGSAERADAPYYERKIGDQISSAQAIASQKLDSIPTEQQYMAILRAESELNPRTGCYVDSCGLAQIRPISVAEVNRIFRTDYTTNVRDADPLDTVAPGYLYFAKTYDMVSKSCSGCSQETVLDLTGAAYNLGPYAATALIRKYGIDSVEKFRQELTLNNLRTVSSEYRNGYWINDKNVKRKITIVNKYIDATKRN